MSETKKYGPDIYKRNEHGLFENADYKFNEDGSVDWRAMIKPEFLYPNRDWFEARGMEAPLSIDELLDNQLLIMLGGIKELAKLRGYHSVDFSTDNISDGYVTAKCTIEWIGNYESSHVTLYTDVANATLANTDDFCAKFLETIACNRAFVRCVRNYLGIHIVGADEIDKSKTRSKSSTIEGGEDHNIFAITPEGTLKKALIEVLNIKTIDEFKEYLRELWKKELYKNEKAKEWDDFSDIPAKECRVIIALIRNNQEVDYNPR
jgi:hypothetical protein